MLRANIILPLLLLNTGPIYAKNTAFQQEQEQKQEEKKEEEEQKPKTFVFSFTYADHRNHDTSDLDTYIEAKAFELYARYTFKKRYRVVAGMNYLEQKNPDAIPFNIRMGLFDFVYAIRDLTFRSVLFAEFILDKSRRSDGENYNNVFVVGFRYAFQI